MLHCCSLHCSQNVAKPAAAPVDDRTDNLCKGNLEIAKLQPCPTIKEHLTNEIGRWSCQDLVLPGPHHQRWATAKRGYGPGRTMWSWQDQVLVPLTVSHPGDRHSRRGGLAPIHEGNITIEPAVRCHGAASTWQNVQALARHQLRASAEHMARLPACRAAHMNMRHLP